MTRLTGLEPRLRCDAPNAGVDRIGRNDTAAGAALASGTRTAEPPEGVGRRRRPARTGLGRGSAA